MRTQTYPFHGLVDIIFPRNCFLCRNYHPLTHQNPLCPACQKKLPWNKKPALAPASMHFDEAWGILHYTGHAATLLKHLKFNNKTSLRRTCTGIFQAFMHRHHISLPNDIMVIPMPLHPSRLRERGYNQATLIAQGLAELLKRPLHEDILERHRPAARQSSLHAKERWTNIVGAFRIRPLADIVGKNILLVDDILTTGATASEAAKTLKEAGASRVIVMTLASATCASCTTTS